MSEDLRLHLADEAATLELGRQLAGVIGPGLICLSGNLGAGKTCLVRGLLRGLGYDGRVKSPTYTLIEPYITECLRVSHWDLYRLGSGDELEALGLREHDRADELLLVEWPERAEGRLDHADLLISIEHVAEGREVRLSSGSAEGARWLAALRAGRLWRGEAIRRSADFVGP